jgi:hypothetical protein
MTYAQAYTGYLTSYLGHSSIIYRPALLGIDQASTFNLSVKQAEFFGFLGSFEFQ